MPKPKTRSAGSKQGGTRARAQNAAPKDESSRQTLQVFEIVRNMRGRRYVYPRLTLEGGALRTLGLKAGQSVVVECSRGEIRIRPKRR